MQRTQTLLETASAACRMLVGSTIGRIGLLAMAGVVIACAMFAKSPAPALPATTEGFNARFEFERSALSHERVAALTSGGASSSVVTAQEPPKTEPASAAAEVSALMPAPASVLVPDATPAPIFTATLGPVREASLLAEPALDEYPKSVTLHLPMPRPPLSPAQRLELQGKDYDRAEKCLAQAVYFEARNEAARGQQAVAQVVLNRVFSPHYPKDVCSVVYQNAHRHLACQFTFACDGKPEQIREHGAWARANRVAQQTLNAWVWLPEVNKATHYHASYVRPNWIRDMKVMARYGLHIFYRPHNWGDGANEANWGTAHNSVKSTAPAKPAATRSVQKASASRSVHRMGPRRAYARYHRA